jgi:catechol 2,3-dioxygenase-like lactoylglutathione lyase family enzyme
LRLEPLGIAIGAADGENVHGNPIRPGSGAFELCIYVDDIEEACARLRSLGAKELRPPVEEPWNESRAYFADPDGNTLHLARTS